jgi:hypothetical protein
MIWLLAPRLEIALLQKLASLYGSITINAAVTLDRRPPESKATAQLLVAESRREADSVFVQVTAQRVGVAHRSVNPR